MLRDQLTVALEATRRASTRSAAMVHLDMKRGLDTLATIISTAPWIGLVGTVIGIVCSFGAINGEKSAAFAAVTQGLSDAMVPTALGLIVALMAMGFRQYLLERLEAFGCEMETASLQLINDLLLLKKASSGKFVGD